MLNYVSSVRLRLLIPALLLGLSILSAVSIGSAGYFFSVFELNKLAEQKILAITHARHLKLTHYLNEIESSLRVISKNPYTIQVIRNLSNGWDLLEVEGLDQTEFLQKTYITDNPHPIGKKDMLVETDGFTLYEREHARHHPWMRQFQMENGFYDVFLINAKGDVVYSVFKELDFATNVKTGQYKESGLGRLFASIAHDQKVDAVVLQDFSPYAPSNGSPASFMGIGIYSGGEYIGALVYQMPADRINALFQYREGLGETGQSYILGQDQLYRTDLFNVAGGTILKQAPASEISTQVLKGGREGVILAENNDGEEMIAAYKVFNFKGISWSVVAEIAVKEINAAANSLLKWSIVIVLIVIAVSMGIGIPIARRITGLLTESVNAVCDLVKGNLNTKIPAFESENAIGRLVESLGELKTVLIESEHLRQKQDVDAQNKLKQAELLKEWITDFKTQSETCLNVVGDKSKLMHNSNERMSSMIERSLSASQQMSKASEHTQENVGLVASASEELSASIREISTQVLQANETIQQASDKAKESDKLVLHLNDTTDRIGEVVVLIQDIAEQTNLLALNATIEAARAGDAGKGFAVVAGEVKNLASQTGHATEDIERHIIQVQKSSKDTIRVINEISQFIERILEISSAISAAVEEQAAATQEIARNTQEASQSTAEVTTNISQVNQSIQSTTQTIGEVSQASIQLNESMEQLESAIMVFLNRVRQG